MLIIFDKKSQKYDNKQIDYVILKITAITLIFGYLPQIFL